MGRFALTILIPRSAATKELTAKPRILRFAQNDKVKGSE